jgi:hypothetical protein
MICEWIKHCEKSHTMCHQPAGELPTHIIDVEATGDVRLVHAKGQESKYAALTYCWGVATQSVALKKENIDALSSNIPLDYLDPTIKDAIFMTRALGLRYLWVDALCIMQDDSDAAGEELRSMAKIYNNAAVTISASCASSVQDGFLQLRLTREWLHPYGSVQLPYRCRDGTLGRIENFRRRQYNGNAEPINRRAWTMQEQLLSPRLVIFGKDAVVWECQSGQWNIEDLEHHKSDRDPRKIYDPETGYHALSRSQRLLSDPHVKPAHGITDPAGNTTFRLNNALFDPQSAKTLFKEPLASAIRKEWQAIVSQYTARKLTYGTDKLNAISALDDIFKRAFLDHEYICGLFYSPKSNGGDLLHQLLWYVPHTGQRYDPPIAPSWSWACINGPVKWRRDNVWQPISQARKRALMVSEAMADIYYVVYHPWDSENNCNRALAEIISWLPTEIKINYPLVGFSMMGELKIKGPLKAALLSTPLMDHISGANAVVRAAGSWTLPTHTSSAKLNVYLNESGPHFVREFPVWCLRLVEGHGLVLHRRSPEAHIYERIGVFREEESLYHDSPTGAPPVRTVQYWFLGTKDEVVTII